MKGLPIEQCHESRIIKAKKGKSSVYFLIFQAIFCCDWMIQCRGIPSGQKVAEPNPLCLLSSNKNQMLSTFGQEKTVGWTKRPLRKGTWEYRVRSRIAKRCKIIFYFCNIFNHSVETVEKFVREKKKNPKMSQSRTILTILRLMFIQNKVRCEQLCPEPDIPMERIRQSEVGSGSDSDPSIIKQK
jgi:hypothetical protein